MVAAGATILVFHQMQQRSAEEGESMSDGNELYLQHTRSVIVGVQELCKVMGIR